jgi:Ala-tRNA(Pro) deacylase
MLTRTVAQLLESARVPYRLLPHARAYTAQGTAASLHVSGRDFAKCVLVQASDGRRMMAVVPGARHLDLEALGGLLGSDVELLPELDAAKLFPDCEAGAEPPFGNLYGLSTYVDESLARDHDIVFNAGSHVEAVRMKYADWARLVAPAVARIARGH